jgi:nucleoside-diphosphate-sugar epimerase
MFTVVAGTGYTGRRVLARLPANECYGLGRTPIETDRPFARVDFDTVDSLGIALPERYAVLYTCPPDGAGDERLRRFLSVLPHPPVRFVYISTTGVYGDCRGAVVTEETPVKPDNRSSRPRVDAENRLAQWANEVGCQLVILRVPGIYGPGRLGIERIRAGDGYLKESDANPGNRIHVEDLVECCLAAIRDRTPPGIYNVGDGDHRSATWFADEVARQAGLPEPRKITRAEAAQEFSPMRLAFLASSRIVDTARMRDILGVTPRTPEEGIRESFSAEGLEGRSRS